MLSVCADVPVTDSIYWLWLHRAIHNCNCNVHPYIFVHIVDLYVLAFILSDSRYLLTYGGDGGILGINLQLRAVINVYSDYYWYRTCLFNYFHVYD